MFGRNAGFGYISPKIFAKFIIGFLKVVAFLIFATMLCMGIQSGNILGYIFFVLFVSSIIAYFLFKKHPNNTFLLLSILPIIIGFIMAIIVLSQVPTPPSDYTPTDNWYPW